jgi:hypothetical protein
MDSLGDSAFPQPAHPSSVSTTAASDDYACLSVTIKPKMSQDPSQESVST